MALWAASTVGLQYFWPLNIPEISFLGPLAKIVVIFGGLLLVWAQIVLWRHGTTADHSKPTTSLVTEGPFRFSRNPIYLALLLIFTGLAMAYSIAWGLIMVIPFVILVYLRTVIPEEDYLGRQFGPDYTSYRDSVRRWL